MRPEATSRFERTAALVAWCLPFGLALTRASSHAQWRGDIASVRDIALGGVGWGGGLSTALTQVALFVPLGSVTFRTALVSAVAAAVAAHALFGLSLRALRVAEAAAAAGRSRFAAPALASIASMVATTTPSFQSEATVGGGVMVAVALGLVVVARAVGLATRAIDAPLRGLVALGFATGAVVAENAVVGAATAAALVVSVALGRPSIEPLDRPPRRLLVPVRIARASFLAAALGAAIFSAPSALRAFAPNAAIDLGGPFLWGGVLPVDLAEAPELAAALTAEVGLAALALSAFGVFTLGTGRGRWLLVVPAAVVVADLALRATLGATEGTIGLRLLSFAWAACLSAVGVHTFFAKLVALRIPLARAGAALVVAFLATAVALTVEQSSETAHRAKHAGAAAYTDLALDALPPRAAVVVSTPRVHYRLLAASLVEGRRPDVLVIPRGLLPRGDTAARTMLQEPASEPLVRAVAITGASDEYALSQIADVRPLFVEPEQGWGAPEYAHVSVDGAWLRFEAEPLGPSDRKVHVERTLERLAPLTRAVEASVGDLDSREAVRRLISAHAKGLRRSRDRKSAAAYLVAVDKPDAGITVTGSIDLTFAASLAHQPSTRTAREREAERAKVREVERAKAREAERRRDRDRPRKR